MEDQLGRTCLHVTVEENNIRLTECLLVSGTEVNRPEGCGVMPLMIAIIKEQLEMTQLLLKYHAKAHGTFAGLIPSPLQRAESTNNDLIASLLKNHIGQDVQEEKAIFSAYLNSRTPGEPTANDPRGCHVQDASSYQDNSQRKTVITFGDQKTCSNVRSVRNRAPDEFSVFTEKSGDFHTKGYLMQCCGKILGPGGFYYVAKQLLGRQVTSKSFQKICKDANLER